MKLFLHPHFLSESAYPNVLKSLSRRGLLNNVMHYPILDDLNGPFLLGLCRAAYKNGFSGFMFAENVLRPQSSNKKP